MGVEPTDDVISLLKEDHEAVRQSLSEFGTVLPENRAALFWSLTDQLVRHEVAEEVVVYPVLRKEPAGAAICDARLAEESTAEHLLARMEKLDPVTEEFMGAIRDLEAAVLAHAANEEDEVFPLLMANEEPAFLVQLGQKFKGEKLAAPSHPHPHAPNSPLGNKLIGPVAAFIDRIRDATKEPAGPGPSRGPTIPSGF